MAIVRVSPRPKVVVVAGFVVSAPLAALVSSRDLPASVHRERSFVLPPSTTFASLPAAFRRLRTITPLSGATRGAHWAPVLRDTTARRAPRSNGPAVGRIDTRTPEGTANIVVADKEVESHGMLWERVMLSVLPNGTEGWVPRNALGGWSFVDTRLVIDRARLTATLLRGGRAVFRAPVGVGAAATPTPTGQFYVRDRLHGFAKPMYGPLAFGTNARSHSMTEWPAGGFVGIHGTNRPDLIPGRISHGCIRLTNRAVARLGKLMPIGTPVTVK